MAEKFNDRAIPASQRYPEVNLDMDRHVDDRVERCQEDFQRDLGDEHDDPYALLKAKAAEMRTAFREFRKYHMELETGDIRERIRRFQNRNA